ncbi:hypothetical protein [Aliihoeflea sp. 40Bstr573]|uniref:hypothetical protein n=1 Tax=Aliihoeflea sp. 40Bstr573 TaxID=2696467 RepID=UPI002095D9DF|nr:hypothetical protein [Aliihoeflea sp. 40Bstr573]MCO6385920.1 hypothetical protein [Aliihoeflea sp. 40Bstr573]
MTDAITKLRTVRDGLAGITELLLAVLDDLDGDCDLEDTDADQAVDDDRCDERDSGDDEPWLAGHPTWGHAVDLELDPAELGEPEAGI